MELGLFTPVFNSLGMQDLIRELQRYPAIRKLELGTGEWPEDKHLDLGGLLASKVKRSELLRHLSDADLAISALSCHGNPLHPQQELARRDDEIFCKTVQLAELLEVPVVVTFSGCPGGGPHDKSPNWITTAWPPEYAEALEWQWNERVLPYWRTANDLAKSAGIRVALEAHPGFCVYNPETLLRLRDGAGDHIGINLDPSHLWWQGIDIPTAIAYLGEAIFHVHAKDVAMQLANCDRNGVLDTKSYAQISKRSWLFRSVGWGHSEMEWKKIVSALRIVGYDGVLSIEHEDALASVHEGLSSAVNFLSRILLRESPVKPWWV